MTPDDNVRRKNGRRPARRDQEPVLDEKRERLIAGQHPDLPHAHILNDLAEPGLAWLIERTPDEDSGPEYMIVKVTPIRGWVSYPEAAHGTTVLRYADGPDDTVMSLISQAREALPYVMQKHPGVPLSRADLADGERGWHWERSPHYASTRG